jgi:hypothetical protein
MKTAKNAAAWSAMLAISVAAGGCGAPPEDEGEQAGVIALDEQTGEIALAATTTWTLLPGSARDVAGGSVDAWVIGTASYSGGYRVYRWNGSRGNWDASNRGGVRITAEYGTGRPWIVNNGNEVWRLPSGTSGTWVKYNGCAKDIGAGIDSTQVWVIGCNAVGTGGNLEIYRINSPTSRTLVSGGAVRIGVAPGGVAWVVNAAGRVYRRTTNTTAGAWEPMSANGRANDIAPNGSSADTLAWIIGRASGSSGNSIEYLPYAGASWVRVNGSAVSIGTTGFGPKIVSNNIRQIFWGGF